MGSRLATAVGFFPFRLPPALPGVFSSRKPMLERHLSTSKNCSYTRQLAVIPSVFRAFHATKNFSSSRFFIIKLVFIQAVFM